jgi:phosphatidyl-myo-inositol dimannoside synthase
MKLLVTLDFPPEIGGIQRYLFDIVRFTFSSEDRVLVGCSRKPLRPYQELHANIKWISTPLSLLNKKFSCIPMFFQFIAVVGQAKNTPEITCGNVYAGLIAWGASFFMRVRYAVYTHGTEILFLQKKSIRGWVLKKVLNKAFFLYSNSHYTVSLLREAGISKETAVLPPRVVIPLRRDTIQTASEKTGNPVGGTPAKILCVGRLVPRKGFSVLLEALSLLPADMQWQCTIVGDGPLKSQLTSICSKRSLSHRVAFKKTLSDEELSHEYDQSSIFVLPAAHSGGVEGFGIVLIEAMAHKVPVIAGRSGGVAEVLENGACGILVEPGDAIGLSREIGTLLKDDVLRLRLAKAAFERVKRCYAW